MVKNHGDELSKIDPIIKDEIMGMQTCPKCGSTKIMQDVEYVEIVCMDCGFVVNQKFVEKDPKWSVYNKKQKTKRAKTDLALTYTIHAKGSTTAINWNKRDNQNKNFSANQKTQVYHLRKWQRRIKITGSTERNLTFALSEITKNANKLNLPKNVLETAADIYQKAVKEHLTNGRSVQSIAASALYLACRQHALPITLDKITQTSTVNKKEIGSNYRFLIKKLNYPIPQPLQPNQCITKFFNQITMQKKAEEIAHKILMAAKDSKLVSGREPIIIAAVVSYAVLLLIGEHKTQKEIADIAQITEVTVRNRYKEMVNQLIFEISL
jgi:transcription initiation factor TFIIB